MRKGETKNIDEYNSLIQNLNPTGKYQMIMFGVNFAIWGIAGFLKTIYDVQLDDYQDKYGKAGC